MSVGFIKLFNICGKKLAPQLVGLFKSVPKTTKKIQVTKNVQPLTFTGIAKDFSSRYSKCVLPMASTNNVHASIFLEAKNKMCAR